MLCQFTTPHTFLSVSTTLPVRRVQTTSVESVSQSINQSTGLFVWQLKAGLKHAYKTEVMWCFTVQLPSSAFTFTGVPVVPIKFVQDLGIHIDADLSMRTHVQRTLSQCFGALRQIRRSVPTVTIHMLVVRLVLSRLDCGNDVLHGRDSSLPGTPFYSRR